MRTNIVLDEKLVAKAMTKAGVKTMRAAVDVALRAYLREPDWDFIASMEGSRAVADDYDPSALFDQDTPTARKARPRGTTTRQRRAPR